MAGRSKEVDSVRRFLIAASPGLFLPRWTSAEGGDQQPILYWRLDDSGDTGRESVSGTDHPVSSRTAHAHWVGEGHNRALRLDGYSVWLEHSAQQIELNDRAITIAAWLALESYPVDEAAIVQLGTKDDPMCAFCIDKWGYLLFRGHGTSSSCKSEHAIPHGHWLHLAASFGDSGTTLYVDGVPSGYVPRSESRLAFTGEVSVTLGRSLDCPVIAGVFPTGVLNGLLRDVRIFKAQLSPSAIGEIMNRSKPDAPADLQINGNWCSDDSHRPEYHAIPPRAWTNEPHGLIHWGGKYHLFYQKNANGPYWGHINWGHMTSPDLYRWTEMPVALSPEPGPDAEGCWSGSVTEHNDRLAIIYTGGDGHRSSICLAVSDDGVHFTKHHENPIIPAPPEGFFEFRDPFVWREGDVYYLIIGSAVKDVGGAALLYRSRDLIHWEYRKPILIGDRESSGVFWEMPVFLRLGDQHALVVCEVPGRATYWVGTWQDETFVPHSIYPQRLELFNHLLSPTPYRLEDGRTVMMGIIPDERGPKESWRAGWAHHYSLPRIVTTDSKGRIHQTPFENIRQWSSPLIALSGVTIQSGAMQPISGATGKNLNIRAVFKRADSHSVTLRVLCSPNGEEHTDISYEWEIGRLVLDRRYSSLAPNAKKDIQEATYFPDEKNRLELNVFLDQSVLEVFIDGRAAFATKVYPTMDISSTVLVGCEGNAARLDSIWVASIKPAA
jgi:sucrose-6-phosphate hydrolase SacC (GH32 family)